MYREELLKRTLKVFLERLRKSPQEGIIGSSSPRYNFASPRYQELALAFTLAHKYRVAIPEDILDVEMESASLSILNGWFKLQHRNGGVWVRDQSSPSPQATCYGLLAISQTLLESQKVINENLLQKYIKRLKKSFRFLKFHSYPDAIESLALRYCAIKSYAELSGHPGAHHEADKLHDRFYSTLLSELDNEDEIPSDSGALALTLAFLTITNKEPSKAELGVWKRIVDRCLLATMPNGLYGGGAEGSIASLPIPTGFTLASKWIPRAEVVSKTLHMAWESRFYSSLLDTEVPWLTPMASLLLYDLIAERDKPMNSVSILDAYPFGINHIGSGLIREGDWLLRLGRGGGIGWMYHIPTESCRVFGSPEGLALREGPWIFEGAKMYHSSMLMDYYLHTKEPLKYSCEMYPSPVPGMNVPLWRTGFARLRGKRSRQGIRIVPPRKGTSLRKTGTSQNYSRRIDTQDGALIVETTIPGKVTHRLPVIWPGGTFGTMRVGKEEVNVNRSFMLSNIREIEIGGEPWPPWTVRFDSPVDLIYEPIHGLVDSHPMRYMSAAAATIDIIETDRVRFAWRVG